jgi:hypothetical protein
MLHFKYHVSVTELLSCFDKGPFVSVNSSGVLTEVHFFLYFVHSGMEWSEWTL